MFDWDNMKPVKSAEQLRQAALELAEKRKRDIKPLSKAIAGRPEPVETVLGVVIKKKPKTND